MEFGEYWLQPIQSRLSILCPSLSPTELDAYNHHCGQAMNVGHRTVGEIMTELGGPYEGAQALFTQRMLAKYSWISASNLGRLFSQGCYYALE